MAIQPGDRERTELFTEFYRNRRLAHEVLFRHRHALKTPDFHHEMQDAFHGPEPQVVIEGFRDAAKSTVAEEAFVLGALFEEFRYGVIVGPSHPRAKERLAAIANEFVINDAILQLFGPMPTEHWGADRIILANGVCIQAFGSGMSMRGMRYLEARPTFALIDDLEDEESVKTPELREATFFWLYKTFLPALAKGPAGELGYRVRFMGNRLDRDAVIARVAKDKAWKHYRFPIMVQDDPPPAGIGVERFDLPTGFWRSLWPSKFSLEDIAAKRSEYERLGILHAFDCEYMCEADNPESHIFREGDAKTVAHVRTWQATYAAYDPARTVGASSAMTGVAVFSWISSRLIVWRGDAQLWLPDQIIDDIFATDENFAPVAIGVEATGLEEFIMQPLRHKALQRRQMLPLQRLVPPRGKDTFIRGLQPFFKSGEVEFVDVSPEARGQLSSFPTGRKDFPNALAYALLMRPGLPIYDFGRAHVEPELTRYPNHPWYLAVNATNSYTTAVLLQVIDGQIRIYADWIREGPPGDTLSDISSEARLDAGGRVRLVVPPAGHSDIVGLRSAVRTIQSDPRTGGQIQRGRDTIRDLLAKRRRDAAMLTVQYGARWTLNALSGGFAFGVDKRGQLGHEPVDNEYKVLVEGLESFASALGGLQSAEDTPRIAYGDDGRPYKTIRANLDPPRPSKDEWEQFGEVNEARTLRRG
ncbi:MAG TPA: hypothetical protein VF748_15100 [Candidatus Acidoferrum sp.]